MKSLTDIITELQAVDKTELDNASAAIDQAVTDLQALAGQTPAADPVVSLVAKTESGAETTFVPQAN